MSQPPYRRRSRGKRLGRSAIISALIAFLGLLLPFAVGADEWNHAGVVVRHGDGRLSYAYVAFAEETISGAELLHRSEIPIVTVSFGGLGEGICMVEEEGCPPSECRRRVCQGSNPADPFWQYFRQAAPGVWEPLVLGASATKVHDGDVDGWSWTGGAAALPALTLADVARLAGVEGEATAEAGAVPTPAVRLAATRSARRNPSGWTYAAAGSVIAIIAVGGLVAARRRGANGLDLP